VKQYALVSILLIFISNAFVFSQATITIPAVHIPAQHIPSQHLPATHIPEIETPYGKMPGVDIPAVDIPGFDIDAVDTTSQIIDLPDFAKVYRNDLLAYSSKKSDSTINVPSSFSYSLSIKERNARFLKYSGYANKQMLDLFELADLDQSGTLSWDELSIFQIRLFKSYSYYSEQHALRPDQFFAIGGGDCKAWSIVTAAFCHYWGYDAYVACFFLGNIGHAICFVHGPVDPPISFVSWEIHGARTVEGNNIPAGIYIPVDYDHVGSYSNALIAGMTLDYFLTPEEMYRRW